MKKILLTTLIILGFTSSGICQRYFLKIEGDENVNGLSTDPNHEDEILLEDFDFEILNDVIIGSVSGGGAAGKAQSGPITLKFLLSKDINIIFHALHSGEIFTRFTITANNGIVDYLKYEFKNVVLSQFRTEYSESEDKRFAIITGKAGTFKLSYYVPPKNGTAQAPITSTWSFIKNNNSEDI